MIKATVKAEKARLMLERVKDVMTPTGMDRVLEPIAFKTHREVVEATPKLSGTLRGHWNVTHPKPAQYVVINKSKVMVFLEHGTGLTTGGWIKPKVARRLFVALSKKARERQPGLVYGVDYVLAKRVRGIKAHNIVKKQREKARDEITEAFQEAIRDAIRGRV